MFLTSEYGSCNTGGALKPAIYSGVCTIYSDPDDNLYCVREFRADDAQEVLFIELVIRLNDGRLVINDYLLLDNMRWRDANGTISSYLSDLLPAELEMAEWVMSYPIEDKYHGVLHHG